MVLNADLELCWWLRGCTPVADALGWACDRERYDRWVRHADLDWRALRDYGRAVAATIGDLSAEDLDREVDVTRVGGVGWAESDTWRAAVEVIDLEP